LAGLKKKLKALKTALKKSDGEAVVLANKEPKNEKASLVYIDNGLFYDILWGNEQLS